jgi:nucleoid DNA-binding protein
MAKKAAPKSAGAKPASPKAITKAELYTALAEKTGLTKKQVAGVFESLNEIVIKELSKKGPGIFVMPGMFKIRCVTRPATKAKQGINPFTKEPMTIAAKPARRVVKASALKALKDAI